MVVTIQLHLFLQEWRTENADTGVVIIIIIPSLPNWRYFSPFLWVFTEWGPSLAT